MFKRIMLFLMVNILVVATISIVTGLLGVNRYIGSFGINYTTLALFCLVWGMGGAFISLLLSKIIAKWSMGVKIIDPNNPGEFRDLLDLVRKNSLAAVIPMPEVGVYESPEMNAFATGASKKKSLVAVSTGLLEKMDRNELDGVIAHEITHISNGDMVTMTLVTGIVNAFTMFLARIIAFAAGKAVKEDLEPIVRLVCTIVLDIIFSILGSILVFYFSRKREFSADLGAARISSRENMVRALMRLKLEQNYSDNRGASLATLKISGKEGFFSLFSSHPSLDKRIEALQKL